MVTGKQGNRSTLRRAAVAGVASVLGLSLAGTLRAADAPATAGGSAAEREPTVQELIEQNRRLMARVERLEAGQQQQQEQQAKLEREVVDATIKSVSADAEQRSQFLQSEGFTAGYSNGKFLIQSADGAFVLNPNAQFQWRYIANFRNEAQPDGDDDAQAGFEARRLKLVLDGNVFGKENVYHFQWATSRTSGNLVLEEAWLRHAFKGTPWAVKGGTFADPWAHESGTSSKRQLTVERSLLNDTLIAGGIGGESYVQGISGIYDNGGAFRGEFVFQDGLNSRNTNFTDTGGGSALFGVVNSTFGISGRAEYKLDGDWKQYDDFTAMGNKRDLLVVGGGFHWTEGDGGDFIIHTLDVQWEPTAVQGLGLYGAYVGLNRRLKDDAGDTDDTFDWGFLVQAGYMIDDRWEVYARYDYMGLDDGAPTGAGTLGAAAQVSDTVHEITVGVNYYLKGHAAKFTADVVWLPNGSPVNADGTGVLSQSTDEDQFAIRTQFQLLL